MKINNRVAILVAIGIASGSGRAQAPDAAPPSEERDSIDPSDVRAAAVPLVALPLDLNQSGDPIWVRGDRPEANRIATIRLRPLGAAVIEPGPGAEPQILWRALTGNFRLMGSRPASLAGERIYCVDGTEASFAGRVRCLIDQDADGRFEGEAPGLGEKGPDARQLSLIGRVTPLASPIAYREARDDELPTLDADYRNCARDYDRPRFTLAIPPAEPDLSLEELIRAAPDGEQVDPELMRRVMEELARRAPGAATCQEAAPVGSGDPLYPSAAEGPVARLGELTIAIGPRDAPNVRLLGMRNPERLYRLTGIAISPLSETLTARQRQLAIAQRFPRPVLMLAGTAEVNEGAHGVGDVLFTVPVRHGYMGVLTQDTVIRTLLSSRSLAAGTVLYGIPMSSRTVMTRGGIPIGGDPVGEPDVDDHHLVWCVPVEDDGNWTATCLPTQGDRYTILKGQRPAFAVRSFRYDTGTSTNDGAVPVTEREGDLGQPLSYRFVLRGLEAGQIIVAQETVFGGRVVDSREHRIERDAARASGIIFAGGVLSLAPAPDGRIDVRRVRDFRTGADAMRIDSGLLRESVAPPAPAAPPSPPVATP